MPPCVTQPSSFYRYPGQLNLPPLWGRYQSVSTGHSPDTRTRLRPLAPRRMRYCRRRMGDERCCNDARGRYRQLARAAPCRARSASCSDAGQCSPTMKDRGGSIRDSRHGQGMTDADVAGGSSSGGRHRGSIPSPQAAGFLMGLRRKRYWESITQATTLLLSGTPSERASPGLVAGGRTRGDTPQRGDTQ